MCLRALGGAGICSCRLSGRDLYVSQSIRRCRVFVCVLEIIWFCVVLTVCRLMFVVAGFFLDVEANDRSRLSSRIFRGKLVDIFFSKTGYIRPNMCVKRPHALRSLSLAGSLCCHGRLNKQNSKLIH